MPVFSFLANFSSLKDTQLQNVSGLEPISLPGQANAECLWISSSIVLTPLTTHPKSGMKNDPFWTVLGLKSAQLDRRISNRKRAKGSSRANHLTYPLDFVLLVMNPKEANSILSSKVKLCADASGAAGPEGHTAADTDIVMRAEVLSYSRSRRLFAGIWLEGSTLRSDGSANKKLYGRSLRASAMCRR